MIQETIVISQSPCGTRRMVVIHTKDGKGTQSFTRHQKVDGDKWMMSQPERTFTKRTHGSRDYTYV